MPAFGFVPYPGGTTHLHTLAFPAHRRPRTLSPPTPPPPGAGRDTPAVEDARERRAPLRHRVHRRPHRVQGRVVVLPREEREEGVRVRVRAHPARVRAP